jgi:hypothetical protein
METIQHRKTLRLHDVVAILAAAFFIAGMFFPTKINLIVRHRESPLAVERIMQLGNIPKGKTTTRQIFLLNPHLTTVNLRGVSSTCGCTTVDAVTRSIGPLQSSTITVSVTPSRQGQGSESIELSTDRGDQRVSVDYNAT